MATAIQIAFQGGGARFIEMLPIAHALADAHKQNKIRIVRVAGCSAGSICAALIACEADFAEVKKLLVTEGPNWAGRLRRFSTNFGKTCCGVNIDAFRALCALRQAVKGTPLLNTDVLVNFLAFLFAKSAPRHFPQGQPSSLMQDVNSTPNGIRLAITASDLSRGQGETFETGNILERIACSCAIPFAFRTFSDVGSSPYVDGGVCDLLPVERLLQDEDDDGPVFAVSIVESSNQPLPTSFMDYCMQLLSASMNHNVERSKRMAGYSNVIEVKTTLSTFDFKGALKKLSDEHFYKEQYDLAFRRMVHYSQLYQNIPALNTFSLSGRVSAPKIMRSLANVFETSLATKGWSYKKGAALVRADSLSRNTDEVKLADRVTKIAIIQAKADNLVCFLSGAPIDIECSIISTNWTCFNQTKNLDLRIQAVPIRSARKHRGEFSGITEVLLFFEENIALNDVITITSYSMVENTMEGLIQKGADYIITKNNHPFPVDVSDLVLAYPNAFGQITVAPDPQTTRGIMIDEDELKCEYGSVISSDYSFVGLRVMNQVPGGESRAIFTKIPQGKPY